MSQTTATRNTGLRREPAQGNLTQRERRAKTSDAGKDAIAVSVVITVLNDAEGSAAVLEALSQQIGDRQEIVVVDGGSTDNTLTVLRAAAARNPAIRIIESPGANISRGRNVGIESAGGRIIVLTDCGCSPCRQWMARITQPFDEDGSTEFVAGTYRIDAETLLERVVGLATMRGQLEPFDARTFNPSARSVAFTKDTWRRAGGFPEWLYTAEDTLLDVKMRRMGVEWRFAAGAEVRWRPRGSIRAIAKQFYLYGRGDGHTQLSQRDNLYNLRNLVLTATGVLAAAFQPWLSIFGIALFAYFYVYAFHRKSARVAAVVEQWRAYPIALVVQWTVLLADTLGYLVGTIERIANPKRYRDRMVDYLNCDLHGRQAECGA